MPIASTTTITATAACPKSAGESKRATTTVDATPVSSATTRAPAIHRTAATEASPRSPCDRAGGPSIERDVREGLGRYRRPARSLSSPPIAVRSQPGTAGLAETWHPEELEAVERCPACGSAERTTLHEGLQDRFFGTRGSWTLRRCASCNSAYLDPRPTTRTIDRAYEHYYTHDPGPDDAHRTTPARRLRRAVRNGYVNTTLGYSLRPSVRGARLLVAPFPTRRRRAHRILRNLPYVEGGRLLDVGCGTGSLLQTLRAGGWQVEGVEPDPRSAAFARACGLIVHELTFQEASFPAGSFDAITMNHVLEHLPDPVDALRRCHRLLVPGGLFWAATPNLASPCYRTYSVDWVGLDAPRHLVIWSPESLAQALDRAGFEATFLEPFDAAWTLHHSAELRAGRLDSKVGALHKTQLSLRGRMRDLRSLRDATRGEELVVLARARPH